MRVLGHLRNDLEYDVHACVGQGQHVVGRKSPVSRVWRRDLTNNNVVYRLHR